MSTSLDLALAFALLGTPVQAQQSDSGPRGPGPLVTDRPDQTESTNIVPVGSAQLEAGWTLDQSREGGLRIRTHTIPGTLARVGILDQLEARVAFGGFQTVEAEGIGTATSGLGDMEVGFKYRMVDGGALPEIALIGHVTIPTGEEGFSSERVDPTVLLAFANPITDWLSVGYNLGSAWSSVDDGAGGRTALIDVIYSVAFGFALGNRLGVFAESFGTLGVDTGSDDTHLLDGGFTYQLSDRLQLDASGGLGLNAAASDWFVAAGFSIRLPR